MKGRAHSLLSELKGRFGEKPFLLATAILKARVVPDRVTPDLDDPDVERRILSALEGAAGLA
jgi:hypothetical protein